MITSATITVSCHRYRSGCSPAVARVVNLDMYITCHFTICLQYVLGVLLGLNGHRFCYDKRKARVGYFVCVERISSRSRYVVARMIGLFETKDVGNYMLLFVDDLKVKREAFRYYQRLQKLEQHILANYQDETISLSTAAAVMVMEKTYCSSFFRRTVGVPFTQWLSLVRLHIAAEQLASCDCRISDVAYAVGFGDIRTFERHFKRQTSLTPREYVLRVRSNLTGAPGIKTN